MPTIDDVIQDLQGEAEKASVTIMSWRITGKGVGKGTSGSCVENALLDAREATDGLPPGPYQLWVTDNTKQVFSGAEIWGKMRRFDVSEFTTEGVKDERLAHLTADNARLRQNALTLHDQVQTLSKTLTDTTAAHARALAATGEGIAKIVQSSVDGMGGLAAAHVELLDQSKQILVASATDARDAAMRDKTSGIMNRILEGLIPDLSSSLKNALPLVFDQGLPLALEAGKWLMRTLPGRG